MSSSPIKAIRYNKLHYIWIAFLFGAIGFLSASYQRPDWISEEFMKTLRAGEGTVTDVRSYASGDQLKVELHQTVDVYGNKQKYDNLNVIIKTDGFSTKKGDIIYVKGEFIPLSDNPNYPSSGYSERMKKEGYSCRIIATSDSISIKGFHKSIFTSASLWKDRVAACLEKSSLERETSDFITAILLGDRIFISDDTKQSFSNAGLAHILALSGMHIAILMGILMTLTFPLAICGIRLGRYWIAIAGIWIFAFFSGLAPATIRACIMATFVVISLTFQRRKNAGNALLASALVILIISPDSIHDVGFQLSFLCVACILMFATQLNPVDHHNHPRLHAIVSSILVSLSATIGTWVVISYYFKKIPLLFLPANLILLPLLPPFMFLALVYTIFLTCGIDLTIISELLNWTYDLIINFTEYISSIGECTLEYKATFPTVLIWIIGILMLGYAISRKKKFSTVAMALVILVISVAAGPSLANEEGNGIIFQSRYRDMSVAFYEDGQLTESVFPRNTISRLLRQDIEIYSIDCLYEDSIRGWINDASMIVADKKKGRRER